MHHDVIIYFSAMRTHSLHLATQHSHSNNFTQDITNHTLVVDRNKHTVTHKDKLNFPQISSINNQLLFVCLLCLSGRIHRSLYRYRGMPLYNIHMYNIIWYVYMVNKRYTFLSLVSSLLREHLSRRILLWILFNTVAVSFSVPIGTDEEVDTIVSAAALRLHFLARYSRCSYDKCTADKCSHDKCSHDKYFYDKCCDKSDCRVWVWKQLIYRDRYSSIVHI